MYAVIGYILFALLVSWFYVRRRLDPLYSIPAVGPSWPLISYLGAFKFARHAREMLQEGYDKYKGSVFRISMLDRWAVIFCGTAMNEELQKLPDDQMSFLGAVEEVVQHKYTIAEEVVSDPFHINIIRGPLTRNLAALLPAIVDEIDASFRELIPTHGNEWVTISAVPLMARIVCRVSNRVFVGMPTCRNSELLDIVINFTRDVAKGRFMLSFVPIILKPQVPFKFGLRPLSDEACRLVGPLLPWSRRALKQFSVIMKPVVEDRMRQIEEHGKEWAERPNVLMTWLVEEAIRLGKSADLIVQALLVSNFVANHTSTISVTHALYHLAASPEYIQPLREEIDAVLKTEGWTKVGIGKMWKLDSFMRESQRLNGISGTLKDVTLSDGTLIPAGTLCGAAAAGTHHDEENYNRPHLFDPFRFSDKRFDEDEQVKHQYVTTSPQYIPFGHGRHACPGRFFAANELKAVVAYFIVNYDVMFPGGGERPGNVWFGSSVIPDQTAQIMFRKRQRIK
ncbi:uncharacterized protein FIBRA_00543 [Fibroporia radiculosa]|uniref:Cytochrome P450 n=1 Tax=Fibroporia radiculosa TaxID=599839 RepID=J4G0D9_9APHY|nr:uncharacterized protein FIBRA_00543 [Fibroporia radiculosa]CCL98543.1 predicted protein [Fibroporia radiculosa]